MTVRVYVHKLSYDVTSGCDLRLGYMVLHGLKCHTACDSTRIKGGDSEGADAHCSKLSEDKALLWLWGQLPHQHADFKSLKV